MTDNLRVTVWNEYRHEKSDEAAAETYPDGIHAAIATSLGEAGFEAHTATLDEPEHGLTDEVLEATDVLVWWGHIAHDEVEDAVVEKVRRRVVLDGMGLIVLHSGHFSKVFKRLMGITCDLKWRESDDRERLWVVSPGHPISEGIGEYIEIEHEETYGEFFDVPPPEELVFVSWFSGGEVFRSGLCYRRGRGKIFYFRPGHETLPTYHNPQVQRVIANAVRWAAPTLGAPSTFGNVPPAEGKASF
ncbi:MAG: ThuA domain-containing protein [Rubrobacteraceae bacterium]